MSKAKSPPPAASPEAVRDSKRGVWIPRAVRKSEPEGRVSNQWRSQFLITLAETSNVKASAEAAKISPSRAYQVRRENPAFAAAWRRALHEGYENLEMETLAHLRNPGTGHKMDIAGAIRLLTLHREFMAQERARADNRSEAEVLDSIDRMIDEMRERAAANARILAEDEDGDAGETA